MSSAPRSGTTSVLFTDIVGSTALLGRLGEPAWQDERRAHVEVLRDVLAAHRGIEVKHTGDGLMAVFESVVDLVEASVAIQRAVGVARLEGSSIHVRVGGSIGEATQEAGDWFGVPVVEAARLCALAEPDEVLVTGITRTLAASADVTFVSVGPVSLKGFDAAVEVVRVKPAAVARVTVFADIDRSNVALNDVRRTMDYWEGVPAVQELRSWMVARAGARPGDAICDIGCGSGAELVRLASIVRPDGRAVGVDPSAAMLEHAAARAAAAGQVIEVVAADGRATGLPSAAFDVVRMERVLQHVGELEAFMREAWRLLRPGGRFVVADTDWGSWLVHPGDPALTRRLKGGIETGPMAEPWAGRKLPTAVRDAGFSPMTSRVFAVQAVPGVSQALEPITSRAVEHGLLTAAEAATLARDTEAALQDGTGVWALTMVAVCGTKPVQR